MHSRQWLRVVVAALVVAITPAASCTGCGEDDGAPVDGGAVRDATVGDADSMVVDPGDVGARDAGELDAGSDDDASAVDAGGDGDAGGVDAGSDGDAGGVDAGGEDDAGAVDAGSDGDAGGVDAGGEDDAGAADAGCVPSGICPPGGAFCPAEGAVQRCVEVAPCEFGWGFAESCPPGEMCGLLLDGRTDCAPLVEHVCTDDVVPVYGWRCTTEGASYCAPGGRSAFVCRLADADECLDIVVEPCVGDDECNSMGAGSCHCQPRCTQGDVRCGPDLESEQVCGDSDADGCMEWETPTPCPAGQTCLASTQRCSATCTDDCGALGPVGCFRGPVSVGECGHFDSDPCRDQRYVACPSTRPLCDTATRTCAECFGGIDCAPAIEACVGLTCTPPAGTCFEGVGTMVRVPASLPMGDITVFLGLRLPAGRPPAASVTLRHPDTTLVTLRVDLIEAASGYADSVFGPLTGAMQPEIAALATHAPGGIWTLTIVPFSPTAPVELVTWAVCVD